MSLASAITVGYWTIRGLGAPLRMIVMYSGANLHSVGYDLAAKTQEETEFPRGQYDAASWFKNSKPELRKVNPLINLPYIIDDGLVVSQTNACLTYLGKKYNLWGKTTVEDIQCQEFLCEIMDVRNKMVGLAYGRTNGALNPREATGVVLEDITSSNGIFQKFESVLERNNANAISINRNKERDCFFFLVGTSITAPDFHLWEMLDQYISIASYYAFPSPLNNFPLLSEYFIRFRKLKGNEKYFLSKLCKLPMNNKTAIYGSTPSGDQFITNQEYDWANINEYF